MQNLIKVPVLSWPFAICFTKPLNQQKKNPVNKYNSFALQPCQVSLVCVEGAEQLVAEANGLLPVLCSFQMAISQCFGKCNRKICIKEQFKAGAEKGGR